MNKAKKIARVKELFRLIDEATDNLPIWKAELSGLFSDGKPKRRRAEEANTKTKPKGVSSGGNGSGRGELTAALRASLKSMPPEFTGRELIAAAGIKKDDEPSAFAAISRMDLKTHEIKKSTTTPGKYRRA